MLELQGISMKCKHLAITAIVMVFVAACSGPKDEAKSATAAEAPPRANTSTEAAPMDWASRELPSRKIPNIPATVEAYYAPDSFHVIAQTQDPMALRPDDQKAAGGALTWIFKDDGSEKWQVNDHGQDACSWFFPDMKHIAWISTRDNMDMPIGNWDNDADYPQGAEIYVSDWKGGNIKRLTNNKVYEAEVTVSPDGKWIVFGRQIDGNMDIWRMKADGTDEKQITFTPDWQEGAPYFLPDGETILFRAWKRSEYGKVNPQPMTVFTLDADTKTITPRTFDNDMNWASYPTPDGRHYVFVRVVKDNNWEVFLGDIQGGAPVRLTYHEGFDGFPSVSPDGKKMLFTRKVVGDNGLYTWVMDISSLNVGPKGNSATH